MTDRDRVSRFLRSKLRSAGRQIEEASQEYRTAKERTKAALPTGDEGRARIVCRRYAEQRAVELDAKLRPACFDAEHTDCQGCVEDIRDGRVETW